MHNLLFCAHTLCMNYVSNTFLLVSSSVRSKQLLCFVYGQGQKREQKPTTKKVVGFHNHSPLLTMIAAKGGSFSLIKMSGKLYKPCMCLIWSQWCRCLYISLSLSLSACSYVRTNRVLFVFHMYKELQPGQVNSYPCVRSKAIN